MRRHFAHVSLFVSDATGSPWAFLLAAAVIAIWGVSGPFFGFSDTWQLSINTGTTIVTFLMVFLIQSTQNRDSKALHLKLNELIRGVNGARTELVGLEELSDEDLEQLHSEFENLHKSYAGELEQRKKRSKSGGKKGAGEKAAT